MYIIIILLLIFWLGWIYTFSGQLAKDAETKIKRKTIFFISIIAAPLFSLISHFMFFFLYDSQVFGDWIFIIDGLVSFVCIPIFTPKITFISLTRLKK
jgi:hypothetical protein